MAPSSDNALFQIQGKVYIPRMEEVWEDAGHGYGSGYRDEHVDAAVVYRTQREVDAIFARLRAWRDRGQTS